MENFSIVTIRITEWESKCWCEMFIVRSLPSISRGVVKRSQFKCSGVSVRTLSRCDHPPVTHPEAPESHKPVELFNQHIDIKKENQGIFRSGASKRKYLFILIFFPFLFFLNPPLESFGIMKVFSVVLLLLHALGEFFPPAR